MDPFESEEIANWATDVVRRYESSRGGSLEAKQSEQEAQSHPSPGVSPIGAGSSSHACSELVGSGETGSPGVPGDQPSSSFLAPGADHLYERHFSFHVPVHRGGGIYSSEMGLSVPLEEAKRWSLAMGWGTEWLDKPLSVREQEDEGE